MVEIVNVQTSDIIATIALIVSLLSIWVQDRGVRKQLLVANVSEYTKRYQEIIMNLPKSVVFDDFNLASLNEEEQDKVLRHMWIYFDLCYEEFSIHHDLRLINRKLWHRWKSGMVASFTRPAFQQSWYLISQHTTYPPAFVNFVNSLIKNEKLKIKNIFIHFVLKSQNRIREYFTRF